MEFKRIVAVTGLPGLFEVVSSKNDGALVRSLEDKSTKFVSSRVHNMSHLESIEVYTNRENVQLTDVFAAMKESKEKLPDLKDNNAIRSYFEKVYPEMDFERVYASDMKKMVKWYSVIDEQKIDFTPEPEEEEEEEKEKENEGDVEGSEVKEKKAKKTEAAAPAKSAKESKSTKEVEETEEKKAPAKKAAAKKASTKTSEAKSSAKETEEKPKKAATKKKKED